MKPSFVAVFSAAAVFLGTGAVLQGVLAWQDGPAAQVTAPPAPVPGAKGCAECGWIESKRRSLAAAADPLAPQVWEYTVRMRDGSSSVFFETLPATWRLGERLMVIDAVSP